MLAWITTALKAQKTIHELERDKSQLSAILSNMVEAVVAVDTQKRVLFTNAALARLFHLPPEGVEGQPFLKVFGHHQLNGLVLSVLQKSAEQSMEIVLPIPEEHIFQAHAAPLWEEGRCAGTIVVLYDITRLRRLEQVRRDFVANVSHEIRTPLAAIVGSAETLLDGAIDDDRHRLEFVQAIQQDALRLTRLVEDLLDLSAIESGRRQLSKEPLDVLELARETAESLRAHAAPRKVALEVSNEPVPAVQADRNQLRQVLTNLIDNAIKFNRANGIVKVAASANDGWLTVLVTDNGPGIPAADLPRLFERFYRVDKARSRKLGGTGLGLSIVKHIIEAHGGSVMVESVEGQGSTFRFTLPLS